MSSEAEQRQAIADLSEMATRELLGSTWLAHLALGQLREVLMELLPAIADFYGDAGVALAAAWYVEQRDLAEARGTFDPVVPDPPTRARWESLARWSTGTATSAESALMLASGGMQRHVADSHRLTITESALADPAASGWRRVGVGGSCGFCRMLIDRGHVYSDASVTFRSHDHCNCAAAPEFSPNVTRISREVYRQSQRVRSEATKAADNARVRKWVATH